MQQLRSEEVEDSRLMGLLAPVWWSVITLLHQNNSMMWPGSGQWGNDNLFKNENFNNSVRLNMIVKCMP